MTPDVPLTLILSAVVVLCTGLAFEEREARNKGKAIIYFWLAVFALTLMELTK
jgi:hypothetical protein